MDSPAVSLCFYLSRYISRRRKPGDAGLNPATFDPAAYSHWREEKLFKHFTGSFRVEELREKDVLDLGCGDGALCVLAARAGARSVTGVDLSERVIREAREICPRDLPLKFVLGNDPKKIAVPDHSADVILCFSMMEHVMEYASIMQEWRRVLRPEGRVLIWWMPWLHPYGHHVEDVLPLPWAHALFSERTIIRTCARLYDAPDFRPRFWDQDTEGRKKPNDYLAMERLPDLNHLTMREFERQCHCIGLRVISRQSVGFRGKFHFLTQIPLLREYFTSHVVYRLGVAPRPL